MTAPELVELIAKTLWVNGFNDDDPWDDLLPDDCDKDEYLAKAHAVVEALTEAGTVEWGMQSKTFIDGDWDRVWTKDPDSGRPFTERKARNHLWLKSPIPFRLVSRLTLPWTAVK